MTLSMYELHQPLTVGRKTHFWDWFDGDDLHSRWTFTDINGTNSGSMDDAADGGYKIVTGTSNNNNAIISFNDIRHYSNTGCVCIATVKAAESTSRSYSVGLTEQTSAPLDTRAVYHNDTAESFQLLRTQLNTTNTDVNTSLSIDENWHVVKIDLRASSVILWVDGNLEAISTTNLPDVKLQPHFRSHTRTTAARNNHVRYMEAYNT